MSPAENAAKRTRPRKPFSGIRPHTNPETKKQIPNTTVKINFSMISER
jgi:hypothetical protein